MASRAFNLRLAPAPLISWARARGAPPRRDECPPKIQTGSRNVILGLHVLSTADLYELYSLALWQYISLLFPIVESREESQSR